MLSNLVEIESLCYFYRNAYNRLLHSLGQVDVVWLAICSEHYAAVIRHANRRKSQSQGINNPCLHDYWRIDLNPVADLKMGGNTQPRTTSEGGRLFCREVAYFDLCLSIRWRKIANADCLQKLTNWRSSRLGSIKPRAGAAKLPDIDPVAAARSPGNQYDGANGNSRGHKSFVTSNVCQDQCQGVSAQIADGAD